MNRDNYKELLEIFKGLIQIASVNPPGYEKDVVQFIKEIFDKDGIESQIYELSPGRSNIYAEIGEGDKEPVLLLSHIDVVPASGQWKYPPFQAHTQDGIIYGRGALDTKQLTAMQIMAVLLLKRSGKKLARKIKFLATADEEGGSAYGMGFISEKHPRLMDAEYVISEGGGFVIEQGERSFRTITCGEKGACAMTLNCRKDQDVSCFSPQGSTAGRLMKSLMRLSSFEAEEQITPVTEWFLKAVDGKIEDPTLKNLWQYSTRSCLMINGFDYGESELKQEEVNLSLNFSFIHGTEKEDIIGIINGLLAGESGARVEINDMSMGYENSMDNEFIEKLNAASIHYDSDTVLLPMIALGRTDGRFIRKNVYGYSPLLGDIPFSQVLKMVHQDNECISEHSLCFGADVIYDTLCMLV